MTGQPGEGGNSATFVRFVRQRPPSAALVIDVEVTNDSRAVRWLLIPAQLPPEVGGVFAVETLVTSGERPSVFARVLGLGGRLAFRIGAGETVRLKDVAITWWGDEPGEFSVPVELARGVTLEGKALEDWFAEKPTVLVGNDDGVDVGAGRLAGSRATEGRESLPLVVTDCDSLTLHVVRGRGSR